MKSKQLHTRLLLVLVAVPSLLLETGDCQQATRAGVAGASMTDQIKANPGPHNVMVIVNVAAEEASVLNSWPPITPTLVIRLPNREDAYHKNGDFYAAREYTVRADPAPAVPQQNIVLITMRPPVDGVPKPSHPPQVFIHVGSEGSLPLDVHALRDKPFIIIHLPEHFAQNQGSPVDVPDQQP